jgi:hypothetical protein
MKKTRNYIQGRKAGFAGMNGSEAVIEYLVADNEKIVGKNYDSYIVLGKDRSVSISSGQYATQNSSIDLVSGRLAVLDIPEIVKAADDKNTKIFADIDFKNDAARVYISQRTDIDTNFGLPDGHIGNIQSRSAVAIKADSVRMIARGGGIKLITGTDISDTATSSKKDDPKTPPPINGIELNAGAETDKNKIQPMVLGNNLISYLKLMHERIEELENLVLTFVDIQYSLNTSLLNHKHLGTINAGVIETDTYIGSNVANAILQKDIAQFVKNSITVATNNSTQQSRLSSADSNYILSRFHKLN